VIVVQKGRIIAQGTIGEITRGGNAFRIVVADPERAAETLRRVEGVREVKITEDGLEVVAPSDRGADLNRALAAAGLYASAIVPKQSSLEDVFLELTEPGNGNATPAA